MATLLTKVGYGQVEPNHLSAQRTAQIYGQLPAATAIDVLENGQFVKYDYKAGEVNFTGDGEFMMVFNEVKLYEDRTTYKDYAMKKTDFTEGVITPRVIKTNVGDLFTTNLIKTIVADTPDNTKHVVVGTDGILVEVDGTAVVEATQVAAGSPVFQIAKVYTLADGQKAVKLQRIA